MILCSLGDEFLDGGIMSKSMGSVQEEFNFVEKVVQLIWVIVETVNTT